MSNTLWESSHFCVSNSVLQCVCVCDRAFPTCLCDRLSGLSILYCVGKPTGTKDSPKQFKESPERVIQNGDYRWSIVSGRIGTMPPTPTFTCDLCHSRCMKEYFTMTAHWIHIEGSPLAPTWELWHRVLGSYSVEDSSIDHQGARTLCMPLSHAEFPLSLQRFLIAALLCTYSRS